MLLSTPEVVTGYCHFENRPGLFYTNRFRRVLAVRMQDYRMKPHE